MGQGLKGKEWEAAFFFGWEVHRKPLKDPAGSWTNPPTRAWAAWGPSGHSKWKINIKAEEAHSLGPGVETAKRPWHFLAMCLWESHFLHLSHSFLSYKDGWVH